jgi:hypothetical protein
MSLAFLTPGVSSAAPGEQAVVEFHFKPVPNLQIAIWLEDTQGNFVKDVYVTQATGTLGIGNRPGIWNFLSSWHFPYGPRTNVLPIWGHKRGKTYPKIVFYDDKEAYQDSLGWHESTSSDEPYFCRPLTAVENENILDTMSCPSPNSFHSDKGRFADGGQQTIYPPRTDIVGYDEAKDHYDIMQYAALNDLDDVTGATPTGDMPTHETVTISWDEIGEQDLVAWIEVSLEHDENPDWEFDREDDHYVDTRLDSYGVEWLGQPAIVYKLPFNPGMEGFYGTEDYEGYGDLDGASGDVHPPDNTISNSDGSGADRLQFFDSDGQTVRFGVVTSGWDEPGMGPGCSDAQLPEPEELTIIPTAFDSVDLELKLPNDMPADTEVSRITVYLTPNQDPLPDETLKLSEQRDFMVCSEPGEGCHVTAGPGDDVHLEIDQLFGDYTYQFGVIYEDRCTNESILGTGTATTPVQEFQQIDTFCFIATAAWGGNWLSEVVALRAFRDVVLKRFALGRTLIGTYYAYGPTFAKLIAGDAYLRATARLFLQPIADAAKVTARLR